MAQLVDQDGQVEQHDERGGDHEPGGPVKGRSQVISVDEDEDPGDHEPVRRDVDRDAERAREDDPRTGVAALRMLLLLRRDACHGTDAMWCADIPPNVGAVPYGSRVEEMVVLARVEDPPETPLGPALSPSRAAD